MKNILKASIDPAFRFTFAFTERVLALAWEKRALSTSIDRPIIIIGPERSGTTFIYSLLAAHDDVYSLTTMANRFPDYPFSASLARRILSPRRNHHYRSVPKTIGGVQGGPFPLTEGVRYWLRHLGTRQGGWKNAIDDFLTEHDLDDATRIALPNDLKKRAYIMGKKRVAFKQPGFSLKIRYLDALFPDAIFVHCLRNPASNFLSLLAQKKETGDPDWGVHIPEHMKLPNASIDARTAQQLAVTYDITRQSIKMIKNGAARYLAVYYDLFPIDFALATRGLFQKCQLSTPPEILNNPGLFIPSSRGTPAWEEVTTDAQALQILDNLCQQMKHDFPDIPLPVVPAAV